MISSENVLVSGGQFTQHFYQDYRVLQGPSKTKDPLDILKEAVAPNAFHDSGLRFDPPKCHPRTRVAVLNRIMAWILVLDETTKDKFFMWLTGAAGAGKSAIAQSIVELCIEKGLILASFFFSRSDSSRNHASGFVATLAYQLYCAFPDSKVQSDVLDAINKDQLIFTRTIQHQFSVLFVKPLQHFLREMTLDQVVQRRLLVVIDGLDECIDRTSQDAILNVLEKTAHQADLPLRFLVASRSEHDIKIFFGSRHIHPIQTRILLDDETDSEEDIRRFLDERFTEIKESHPFRRQIPSSWPGEEVIHTIVRRSSGQFIYAATVIRYVQSTRHRPNHRLEIVLDLRPHNGDLPFAELDSLYRLILSSVQNIEKVLRVLSIYCIDSHWQLDDLSLSLLEQFLSYDVGEIELLLCDLGALVTIEENTQNEQFLRILHASLPEFILDSERSKEFHVDIGLERTRCMTRLLQYLPFWIAHEQRGFSFIYIFRHNSTVCDLTPELMEAVFRFPLDDFLQMSFTSEFNTEMMNNIVLQFLRLLKRITESDERWSYIERHQLGKLETVLLQEMKHYYAEPELAVLLVLCCHLGYARYVPEFELPGILSYPCPTNICTDSNDTLLLSWSWDGSTYMQKYREHVHAFLRDPHRSGTYTLGHDTYEKAAEYCIAKLISLECPRKLSETAITGSVNELQDDNVPALDLGTDGRWKWRFTDADIAPMVLNDELCFILMGYLIFLLPLCRRYVPLVLHCQHCIRSYFVLREHPYPVRVEILREKMTDYLALFTQND